MRRTRVYVAGPYTKPDPCINTHDAIGVADRLMLLGYAPFLPHLSHFWHTVSPKPYEDWLRLDFDWIPACDALLRMDGESSGADREVELAETIGIPVYRSIEELEVAEPRERP